MKLKLSLLLFPFLAGTAVAQNWTTTLNSGASTPKFGLSTDHPLGFFTNNTQKMTLTSAGRLGIGTVTPVAPLHVVGKAVFSDGVIHYGSIWHGDHFEQKLFLGTGGNPDVFYTGTAPLSTKYKAPCNVWYKDPTQYETGTPQSVAWTPPTANLFEDLLQVTQPGNSPQAALSVGVLSNGDGVIAIEPTPSASSQDQILKLNPGCTNDVYICEGGGQTKIFGNGYVVGALEANSTLRVGKVPFNLTSRFELQATSSLANVIDAWDPNSTATNKKIFLVTKTGKTAIGTNLTATNAMVTIGQSVKADKALVLTDNTSTTNKDYFTVQGNGYTEIKVYSPTTMPNNRVMTVYDDANSKDLFVIKSNGKVYAREVEISLATTFPDYVFEKGYKLRTIPEVESFIQSNKHLPGFEKGTHYETNGINVNDLLVKQQQQLEEQMLYIIELEKRLKALEEKK